MHEYGRFLEFDVKGHAARVNEARIGTAGIELAWGQLTLLCDASALEREHDSLLSEARARENLKRRIKCGKNPQGCGSARIGP